ncbi:hypothetical protein MMC22_007516 [Lobaria immixta]|nr:hypothetical protein [Lobaria immixta]
MSWFDSNTAEPHGYAGSWQPLPDNSPLMRELSFPRYEIYGSSATPQIYDWDLHGTSERSMDELELPSMPKTEDFAKKVSSSDLSNSSHSTSSRDLDTSVHSNGKEHRQTESCDLEEDFVPHPTPAMSGATQINQRHYCRVEGCSHTKGFARVNDLKRHQKKHNGDTPLWYCGCCKNVGDDSSEACVKEHLRQEHGYNITDEITSSACNCSKKSKDRVYIALPTSEDVSCLRATDRSGSCSPARSQAIKRLIQTDSEPLAKRRRQDSTYSSCDVSEIASTEAKSTEFVCTESNSIAAEDIPCSLRPFSPTASLPKPMPPDSLSVSTATNMEFPACEHPRGVDFQPLFLPELFLPEFIESSHQDHCHPWDNIMKIPTSLDPNADSVLGQHEIDRWTPLGLEQVPNVHPADFLALYRTKSLSLEPVDTCTDMIQGSYKIQNFLTAAVKFLQTAAFTSVSYNPRARTINLRGPVTLIKSAKETLQAFMLEVSRESGLQYLQKKQKELQQKTNVNPLHGTWSTLANHTCDSNLSANVFALRVQQDNAAITTWVDFLLPKLPSILKPAVRQDYTASLVRQGASENDSRPHIRIQSPRRVRSATRKNIKLAIDEICELNTRACIPVSFCTGHLRLLANATSFQSAIEGNPLPIDSEEGDEEEEEDDDPQFLYKRYWQNPGMGASIGMHCTNSVSATLGGYVLVDGRRLLLTVYHFIEDSHKKKHTISSMDPDLYTLTSPSLRDVDEMREGLADVVYDVDAESDLLSNWPVDREIALNGELSPEMERIKHGLDLIETYKSEVHRPEREFLLGELVGHCGRNAMSSIDAEWPPSSESAVTCQMDWALFSIKNDRMGENRHRFQHESDFDPVEAASEPISNWTGDGDFCNDTSNLEPNASVHYVGQRSGLRRGRISAAPMILNRAGKPTKEWAMICPEPISSSDCEGDSGAWVLSDNGNKLVGLLWGWNEGHLLFSPIHEVFADIKKTLPAREVCLPRDSIDRRPPVMAISGQAGPETVLICKSGKRKTPKRYKWSTLLRPKPRSLQSVSRAKASTGNEAITNLGTLFTFETQDITVPSIERKRLPSSSSEQASSETIAPRVESQAKRKEVADMVSNQDSKLSSTYPKIDSSMEKRSQLARPASTGPECDSHTKCQSPWRYILLPVSSKLWAFGPTFSSESQSMKLKYKSSTFPFSQRDIAAQSKGHGFKSFYSHLSFGKLEDSSQSNLLFQEAILKCKLTGPRSTHARRDETDG